MKFKILIIAACICLVGCDKKSTKWEYKIVTYKELMELNKSSLENSKNEIISTNQEALEFQQKLDKILETKLNEFGKEGWEVIDTNNRILMKRTK